MGGVNAGEVASRMAVEDDPRLHRAKRPRERTHHGRSASTTGLSYSANRVRTAVMLANRTVHRTGEQQEQFTGMGTTIAVVLRRRETATICGVGDSRVYLVADTAGQTTDHRSHLGGNNPHAGSDHRTRSAGAPPDAPRPDGGDWRSRSDLDVDVIEHIMDEGHRLVICSDGVFRGVSDELLCEIGE